MEIIDLFVFQKDLYTCFNLIQIFQRELCEVPEILDIFSFIYYIALSSNPRTCYDTYIDGKFFENYGEKLWMK